MITKGVRAAATAAKLLQSCLTLCDPRDGSPPGSPTPGILQARALEWVAISFSNAWKWNVKVKSLSRVQLVVTPWAAAHQAPLSMRFSRQEYWSGVPSPSLYGYYTSLEGVRHDLATKQQQYLSSINCLFFILWNTWTFSCSFLLSCLSSSRPPSLPHSLLPSFFFFLFTVSGNLEIATELTGLILLLNIGHF